MQIEISGFASTFLRECILIFVLYLLYLLLSVNPRSKSPSAPLTMVLVKIRTHSDFARQHARSSSLRNQATSPSSEPR